eukprot:1143390-Pelagomonas_calceolata.AAC.2
MVFLIHSPAVIQVVIVDRHLDLEALEARQAREGSRLYTYLMHRLLDLLQVWLVGKEDGCFFTIHMAQIGSCAAHALYSTLTTWPEPLGSMFPSFCVCKERTCTCDAVLPGSSCKARQGSNLWILPEGVADLLVSKSRGWVMCFSVCSGGGWCGIVKFLPSLVVVARDVSRAKLVFLVHMSFKFAVQAGEVVD